MSPPACVGCGWCCSRDQCELSHRLHGYRSRCPELQWDAALRRYICALMRSPQTAAICQREVFIGQGCCWPDNPWRKDVRKRHDLPAQGGN